MAQTEERRTGTVARLLPTDNRKLSMFAARMGFTKVRALEFLVREYLNDDGVPARIRLETDNGRD